VNVSSFVLHVEVFGWLPRFGVMSVSKGALKRGACPY
jgi:hypothetical protein